jgi:hypothetical protein
MSDTQGKKSNFPFFSFLVTVYSALARGGVANLFCSKWKCEHTTTSRWCGWCFRSTTSSAHTATATTTISTNTTARDGNEQNSEGIVKEVPYFSSTTGTPSSLPQSSSTSEPVAAAQTTKMTSCLETLEYQTKRRNKQYPEQQLKVACMCHNPPNQLPSPKTISKKSLEST